MSARHPDGGSRHWLHFGQVMHSRLRPTPHRFRYGVFFLCFPLSRVLELEGPLFSVNRWNLFGFRFEDHGPRDGSHPEPWIRAMLAREGLACADGEIWLQAFPRVLGYVFNPVSFWYCHDRAGALRAVLAEVNNTFGERHCYLLARPDASPMVAGEWLGARKVFHVSPFFPVDGRYRFRFGAGAGTAARIDYHDADGPVLVTAVTGHPAALDTRHLLAAFFRYPWMTLGVVLRIHWQALRLWLKGVRFWSKPLPPAEEISR